MNVSQNPPNSEEDEVVSVDFYQQGAKVESQLDVSDLMEGRASAQSLGQASLETGNPDRTESLGRMGLAGWSLLWLVLVFISFSIFDLLQTLSTAYQAWPYWAPIMTISAVGLIGTFSYLVFAEFKGFRALRTLETPLTVQKLRALTDKEAVLATLKKRAEQINPKKSPLAYELNQRYFQTLQLGYSTEEVIEIYLLNVEKPLYQKAEALIQKEAQNLGVATAMTPYSSLQILLLIRWSLKVVRQLCELYGLKIGVLARARLIRMLWLHVMIDVAMDQTVNQVLQGISQTFMGKVIDQTSEATTSALLVYRMGYGLLKYLSLACEQD